MFIKNNLETSLEIYQLLIRGKKKIEKRALVYLAARTTAGLHKPIVYAFKTLSQLRHNVYTHTTKKSLGPSE